MGSNTLRLLPTFATNVGSMLRSFRQSRPNVDWRVPRVSHLDLTTLPAASRSSCAISQAVLLYDDFRYGSPPCAKRSSRTPLDS